MDIIETLPYKRANVKTGHIAYFHDIVVEGPLYRDIRDALMDETYVGVKVFRAILAIPADSEASRQMQSLARAALGEEEYLEWAQFARARTYREVIFEHTIRECLASDRITEWTRERLQTALDAALGEG